MTSEDLSRLWDELTPKLYGYLVNTVRDRTLAEDLLQNTWLRAIQASQGFQQRGVPVSAWLFAIARNECRQHWRKAGREVAFDPALHDRAADDREKPESHVMVEKILSMLSEDDRELIRLRYIADLTVNDIAKVLNLNLVAVRVRLHRALQRARAQIL